MKLNQLTIKEALQGLKNKKFSSVELTKSCFDQIKKLNPVLNAFITVCEKNALKSAQNADDFISQKSNLALLGIPIALKDIFLTKGVKTTAGSNVLNNYIPTYSATVVEKLENAGAVVVGKTNLDA